MLRFENGNGSCILVEQINIRGQSCENCTALIGQGGQKNYGLHSDSYYPSSFDWEFLPTGRNAFVAPGEDHFGLYECVNPAPRCSSSPSSTTQTWCGGH